MRKPFILFFIFLFPILAPAALTIQDGKLVDREEAATESVQEHFGIMMKYYESEEWKNLAKEALIVIKNFPSTTFSREANFFLGVAYFKQSDFEMANHQLTDYLTSQATPKYFEEAIQYKFEIAENFRLGARKHLMGFKSMPKWVPAGTDAIAVYDEVISALPHHDLAAHALYGKGQIQAKNEDFRAAIESYQTLIRRFPKHPLAVESYIGVGEIYLDQSRSEYPDPDYLDLAELNLRKFRSDFPSEEKLAVAQENFARMQQYYAGDLFETARFYERTNKWGAAKMYYAKIVDAYPDSQLAEKAQKRVDVLTEKIARIESKKAKK